MTNGDEPRTRMWQPADVKDFLKPAFGLYIAIMFGIVFQSWFLGLLAGAFLVYMPVPSGRGAGGVMTANKILFSLIMLLIFGFAYFMPGTLGLGLQMSGAPWDWNTNSIIFAGVWLISMVVGLLADLPSRQIIGSIMIAVSFVIFAIGVGSQEVGYAFFGQWWPQVHNAIGGFIDPIGDFFSTIQETFGSAFFMLTNPIGYATQLLNGTYVSNPTGLTGAYGVEIKSMDIDQIYVTNPFAIATIIKNEGAFEARDVKLELGSTLRQSSKKEDYIPITRFGFSEHSETYESLVQLDQRQRLFTSDGISCSTVCEHELRERYLPFRATVSYEYDVNSNLEVQFMSVDEWERLARANQLHTAPVASKISSSPVKLSIGTLDQPIREEDTEFHIGVKIEAEAKNTDLEWANITIMIPKTFGKPIRCYPHEPDKITEDEVPDKYVLHFPLFCYDEQCGRSNTIYCNFNKLNIDQPTQTFLVYAESTYRINKYKESESFLQFADQDDCPPCKKSSDGTSTGTNGENGGEEEGDKYDFGSDYCLTRTQAPIRNSPCILGMGGCEEDSHCCLESIDCRYGTSQGFEIMKDSDGDDEPEKMECKTHLNDGNGICCYKDASDDQCNAAFNEWKRQVNRGEEEYYGILSETKISKIINAFENA